MSLRGSRRIYNPEQPFPRCISSVPANRCVLPGPGRSSRRRVFLAINAIRPPHPHGRQIFRDDRRNLPAKPDGTWIEFAMTDKDSRIVLVLRPLSVYDSCETGSSHSCSPVSCCGQVSQPQTAGAAGSRFYDSVQRQRPVSRRPCVKRSGASCFRFRLRLNRSSVSTTRCRSCRVTSVPDNRTRPVV